MAGNINTCERKSNEGLSSGAPKIKSNDLLHLFTLNQIEGDIVIIDGLKYCFDGKDKYYIDKNAKESADIQGKEYKNEISLNGLAQKQFNEIYNLILKKSGTDLGTWLDNVARKVINNSTSIAIEGNNGKKGTLRIFYNPNIEYKKIGIRWDKKKEKEKDEYYCLAKLSNGKFVLDSNYDGEKIVDSKTVYNNILPVFDEYLSSKTK